MNPDVTANPPRANYSALQIDVADLYRRYPVGSLPRLRYPSQPMNLSRFYRTRYLPRGWRVSWLRLLRQTQADLSWFNEFAAYWSDVLGGRPLWGVQDFHYLYSIYRVRFQEIQDMPEADDPALHLAAWQTPQMLFFMLHNVYKEAIDAGIMSRWNALSRLKHLNRQPGSVLDFGCAIGSLARFYYDLFDPLRTTRFYLADIPHLAFHYAATRYSDNRSVTPLALNADKGLLLELDASVDAIFCMAVFEHLNQPLKTAQIFHERLNPGGLLIFDYILSQAEGMDTVQGLRERGQVLEFVKQNFDVVEGKLDSEQSIGLTVVRKR